MKICQGGKGYFNGLEREAANFVASLTEVRLKTSRSTGRCSRVAH